MENKNGKVWNYKTIYQTQPNDSVGEILEDTIWTYQYEHPIFIQQNSELHNNFEKIALSYFDNQAYRDATDVEEFIFKGVTIRAVAYKNGSYSEVVTQHYFVHPEGGEKYSFPIVSLTVDPADFWDYDNGINVPGKLFDTWRSSNSTVPLISLMGSLYIPGNFRKKGHAAEINTHLSFIKNGEEEINQDLGLRIHGHGSRVYPNRALRLYARADYGKKNIKYSFFPHVDEKKFKRLILRNSGQDAQGTLFRDAFLHESSRKMNVETQGNLPVILFINGTYWGVYNLRERYDKKYFKRKYNVDDDEEQLDFIKDFNVKYGTDDHYLATMDFLRNNSFESEASYQAVQNWFDVENVADYYIAETFVDNFDWPNQNVNWWRHKIEYNPNDTLKETDGRWRLMLVDLDMSLGFRIDGMDYSHDAISAVTTPYLDTFMNEGSILLRKLITNEEFTHFFINRYADVLNTHYRNDVLLERFQQKKEKYSPEVDEHTTRWNPTNDSLTMHRPIYSFEAWNNFINSATLFLAQRHKWVKKHLQDRFDAGDTLSVILDVSDTLEGSVKINTIDIDQNTVGISDEIYPWKGVYFKNIPIELTAKPKEGYVFSHWSGDVQDTAAVITINLSDESYIKANFIPIDDLGMETAHISNKEITVFPNPFQHSIHVLSDTYHGEYFILTVQGEVVKQGDFTQSKIDVRDLSSGVYVFKLHTTDKVFTEKIIKP